VVENLYVQETAKRPALFPPMLHFWITALRRAPGNKFGRRKVAGLNVLPAPLARAGEVIK